MCLESPKMGIQVPREQGETPCVSTAAEKCLQVQLLTPGLAAGQGSVLNTRGPQAWPLAASPGAVTGNRNWMVTAVTPMTGKH